MSTRVLAAKPTSAPWFNRPREGGKGQCDCGGSGGECTECKKKSMTAQEARRTAHQPHEARTTSYPRFGYDFGRLRLHGDTGSAGLGSENAQLKHAREANLDEQCDGM